MENKKETLYFITSNPHKFKEIQTLFKRENLNFEIKQINLDPEEIQADRVLDVAISKIQNAKNELNASCFVEDAGFFVDIPLKGFPGVYSSYVMKTIGNEGILRLIDDFEKSEAHFTSVIAFYYQPIDKIITFEGDVFGKISKEKRGHGGFGFDPIFIPNENPLKTFAELTVKQKNRISHRGKAWKKLIEFLKKSDEKYP
jgi:XTP/dITP diphosphohydrolase